ncbi:hypothetical protein TURU_161495 [Turdus rufiventris]|nr:hypothetical protein TURU_161495 [Turdus rufiventris]
MKLHTAAILLLFWLGIFTVHTVKGSASTQRMNKFRCVNLSTNRLNIQNLVSYERQQVPTDAIIFHQQITYFNRLLETLHGKKKMEEDWIPLYISDAILPNIGALYNK